jgi:hypothetical protein
MTETETVPVPGPRLRAGSAVSRDVSYVLPLRADRADRELCGYLRRLGELVGEVILVDASDAPVFAAHGQLLAGSGVRQVPVDPGRLERNGKVRGVLTALPLLSCPVVVIADDDVRYDAGSLTAAVRRLERAALVIPQNFYAPCPLGAGYDTARVLLHRALDGDFPGTLVLRRAALGDGYDGDVLFENLELIRTVEARGGRVRWARDVLVARRPPTGAHLLGQRVRQAYDEFARPVHLLVGLSVVPGLLAAAVRGAWRPVLVAAAGTVGVAEMGRRRGGGAERFPVWASWVAPVWLVERGVCSWAAVFWRLRGGVPYAGERVMRAASSRRALRRRLGCL